MGLNEVINKAIELTISDGVSPDKKLIKEEQYEQTEKAYRLFGA